MLVICSNCKTRLQLDESKIPSNVSKARCPKCQGSVEIRVSSATDSDLHVSLPADMTPPSPPVSAFEKPPAAAPFKPPEVASDAESNPYRMASPISPRFSLIYCVRRIRLPPRPQVQSVRRGIDEKRWFARTHRSGKLSPKDWRPWILKFTSRKTRPKRSGACVKIEWMCWCSNQALILSNKALRS